MAALAVVLLMFSRLVLASDSQILVSCTLSVERDRTSLINGQDQRVVPLSISSTGDGSNVQVSVIDSLLKVDINADFHLEYQRGMLRLYHGKFNISDQLTGQQFGTYLESLEEWRPLLVKYRAQLWRHGTLADYDAKVLCEIVN